MDAGSHITPYLFCERFAKGGRAIDLLPPSEQGATFLARSARLTVVVQKNIADHFGDEGGKIARLVADPYNLPVLGGSFDLVLVTAPGKNRLWRRNRATGQIGTQPDQPVGCNSHYHPKSGCRRPD